MMMIIDIIKMMIKSASKSEKVLTAKKIKKRQLVMTKQKKRNK